MSREDLVKYLLTLGYDPVGQAVVEAFGSEQGQPAMMVLAVVPGKEVLAEGARVVQRTEPLGKGRAVLERLELAFRERIVVGDPRPAQAAAFAEVGKLPHQGFGLERGAAVGMNCQRTRCDPLLGTAFGDQPTRQLAVLALGHQPAHHVAAENVQQHGGQSSGAAAVVCRPRDHDIA